MCIGLSVANIADDVADQVRASCAGALRVVSYDSYLQSSSLYHTPCVLDCLPSQAKVHAAKGALYLKLVTQLLQMPVGAEAIICMLDSYACRSGFGRPDYL